MTFSAWILSSEKGKRALLLLHKTLLCKKKEKKSWDSSKAFIAKTPKNEQNKEHAATAVVGRVVTAEEESKTQDIERHRCSPH